MSATMAPPKGLEFLPVLEKRFGSRVTAEERPAFDVPTLVTDPASLLETARFRATTRRRRTTSTSTRASVDRSKLPAIRRAGAAIPVQRHPLLTKRNEHLLAPREPSGEGPVCSAPHGRLARGELVRARGWDLMGIDFAGHPNQKRLLTPQRIRRARAAQGLRRQAAGSARGGPPADRARGADRPS